MQDDFTESRKEGIIIEGDLDFSREEGKECNPNFSVCRMIFSNNRNFQTYHLNPTKSFELANARFKKYPFLNQRQNVYIFIFVKNEFASEKEKMMENNLLFKGVMFCTVHKDNTQTFVFESTAYLSAVHIDINLSVNTLPFIYNQEKFFGIYNDKRTVTVHTLFLFALMQFSKSSRYFQIRYFPSEKNTEEIKLLQDFFGDTVADDPSKISLDAHPYKLNTIMGRHMHQTATLGLPEDRFFKEYNSAYWSLAQQGIKYYRKVTACFNAAYEMATASLLLNLSKK